MSNKKQPYLVRVILSLSKALEHNFAWYEWDELKWSDLDVTQDRFCLLVAIDSAKRLDDYLEDRISVDTVVEVLKQSVLTSAFDRGAKLRSISESELEKCAAFVVGEVGLPSDEDEGEPQTRYEPEAFKKLEDDVRTLRAHNAELSSSLETAMKRIDDTITRDTKLVNDAIVNERAAIVQMIKSSTYFGSFSMQEIVRKIQERTF
jgi:hypothetical protein